LERGAYPFDIQVLYNTHFSGDIQWWLELVYARTVDTPRAEAWKDPDWKMLDMGGYGSGARFLLWTALKPRQLRLAEWALAHAATRNAAPAPGRTLPQGTLYEEAQRAGFPELAELLARYGANRREPAFSGEDAFVQASLRLDRPAAKSLLA